MSLRRRIRSRRLVATIAVLAVLTAEDRAELEKLIRTRKAERRVIERARIVLASADGLSNREICEAVGVSHATVTRWLNDLDTY